MSLFTSEHHDCGDWGYGLGLRNTTLLGIKSNGGKITVRIWPLEITRAPRYAAAPVGFIREKDGTYRPTHHWNGDEFHD